MFPGVTVAGSVPECSLGGPRGEAARRRCRRRPRRPRAGATRVLSIAAGVTIAAIEWAVGDGVAVMRAMPNTPALVGEGRSAIAAGRHASDDDLDWAERILAGVGMVVRLAEHHIDAVTGLTGSGPAYVFLVAEALIERASRPDSRARPSSRWSSSCSSVRRNCSPTRGDPAALRAMVTSPGGTTAAGLRVLEERRDTRRLDRRRARRHCPQPRTGRLMTMSSSRSCTNCRCDAFLMTSRHVQ